MLLVKLEVERRSRKEQKNKRKKERDRKTIREKLKVSLRNRKRESVSMSLGPKTFQTSLSLSLSLSPPPSPPLSTACPVRFLQLWAGSQDLLLFCNLKWHLPGERSRVPVYQGRRRCPGLAERPLSSQYLSKS